MPAVASIGWVELSSVPSARPILLSGERLLNIGELLTDFLEQAVPLERRLGLDALDHRQTDVMNRDRRLQIGIGDKDRSDHGQCNEEMAEIDIGGPMNAPARRWR